ncbi:MAG: aminotransferase class I/II-fold pyridoxal phosphate-dependent enzyme [Actinomycetota bacterium]|nr:aminotransferase class I/II-fold pyridoxal phosphate-dependent enzyme [Actinomycetota bacterium]
MRSLQDDHAADTLGMHPEEMRRLGHWVVDRVVDHFAHGAEGPAVATRAPDELLAILGGAAPEGPGDALSAMTTLVDVALGSMQHGDHPRYFARVPGPSSFAAVLGEWLATGFNAIAASWGGGSGPTAVELVVIDWLRSLIGMPEGTEGILASGGSLANMIGLLTAREVTGPGVVYLSDQTHASIRRDLVAMGVPPEHVRVLETDDRFRVPAEAVERALRADRRAGRRPAIVVATAGTTNTGAVDPLAELADLCGSEELWLHVDGAYGAPAALCDKGRELLEGIELADSLVVDPHKWLFQPYDIGALLVRRPGVLERTFDLSAEYLADTTARKAEVDLRDRSLELSRRARAIKLWLTLRVHGTATIGAAIERGIELAEHAERVLVSDRRCQVVTPAQLGIVTFALKGAGREEHAAAAARLTREGFAAVTSTALHGKSALRLCTINPRTTEADIEATIARLAESA